MLSFFFLSVRCGRKVGSMSRNIQVCVNSQSLPMFFSFSSFLLDAVSLMFSSMSAGRGFGVSSWKPPLAVAARYRLRRTIVFAAKTSGSAPSGPIAELHREVNELFKKKAVGSPPSVSSAQMVQLLFEVGAVDQKVDDVASVMNKLVCRGFYWQTHPCKVNSYGPLTPPSVGAYECRKWATTLFLERLKAQERGVNVSERPNHGVPSNRVCRTTWCQCGWPRHCALEVMRRQKTVE